MEGDYQRIPNIPRALLSLWEQLEPATKRTRDEREADAVESDFVLRTLTELGLVQSRLEAGKICSQVPV